MLICSYRSVPLSKETQVAAFAHVSCVKEPIRVLTCGSELGTSFVMVAILAHFKCILLHVCMWTGRSILDLAGLVMPLWLLLDDMWFNFVDQASFSQSGPSSVNRGIRRLIHVPGYLVQLLEQSLI